MKTKQAKEELEKSTDDDSAVEPKTRARKKADEEDKNKAGQDEPKTSKEPKKTVAKPRAIVKKKPLGIRKALRSKKAVGSKDTVKKLIKQVGRRGRKPKQVKTEPTSTQVKDEIPMIPVSEIKKEPVEETTPNSRSSSPRGPGRRPRLSSDVSIMKSVLNDSSSLVVGPRTSPYSMRSERSNSPSLIDSKNLRRGNPRKAKALLNEVVIKEQKKRRRLLSDSKVSETEGLEDCKKLKRGRSCSRDGSEISKCSDITESDLSLSESLNDTDSKELKKIDKAKTELDIEIENNVQISPNEKVPSLIDDSKLADSKLAEPKPDAEPSFITNEKTKKSLSLKRSSSLDSDNNNSNRLKLENLNSSDVDDKSMVKTENDTLFEARSSILNSMSKTFNSKEVSKNMRKARRGRKVAAATRTNSTPGIKNGVSTALKEDDKQETLESLSKEIDDLINNLDQNIDGDCDMTNESNLSENSIDQLPNKSSTKPVTKALTESNIIVAPETPVKDKESASITTESTPSKIDDSENIRLHYEEDSSEKITLDTPKEITYKHTTVASIDKLMDRLKEFEEFDKRRQRQESESKSSDSKPVMVTNDVVLIPKSGADIKPLKDIQTVSSPERPMQKENVMSCFENNSAISLLKRGQARKSVDVDLPNSVTLIKRNSISARKESTSSNHSKETDAISIFEKSLGKDVTLTEIRKSVDKTPGTQVDIHQFATLHPSNSTQGVVLLDSNQVSLLPRVSNDVQITATTTKRNSRNSRESLSRKSSESGNDEALATLEKIKSPPYQNKSMEISITPNPVAIKSPEIVQPLGAEALAPPLDSVKNVPDDIALASKAKPEVSAPAVTDKVEGSAVPEIPEITKAAPKETMQPANDIEIAKELAKDDKMEVDEKLAEKAVTTPEENPETTQETGEKPAVEKAESTVVEKPEIASVEKAVATAIEKLESPPVVEKIEITKEGSKPEKPARASKGSSKSARNSIESQPGPSNALHETPESQKRKENVLRTLGLLTHKAAKEAKIEKLKEKERIYSGLTNKKSSKPGSGDYTGTLKTVIKLNRGTGDRDKKRYRSSLKMTFKTKNRGKLQPEEGQEANEDDTYYTIERREGGVGATSEDGEAAPEPEPKETLNLVIPEKASSFSIHPGRLCMDQCFYCGGKFGLFDTPCHIAQMKSAERQRKVLANEEKLTIDSCLCDACYRHVDRRANCPSYRKRPAKLIEMPMPAPAGDAQDTSVEKLPVSPPEQDESEEEQESNPITVSGRPAICHATGCAKQADHSIRRKWLIKMRASVNKLVKLEGDYPGLHTLPLCSEHYRALLPLLACALCRRRITRHHNVHLLHNYQDMNPILAAEGIPVSFAEKPALCKLCRYYCSLLAKSEPGQPHHRLDYRRKLLQIYNIDVPPEPPTTPTSELPEQSAEQGAEHTGEQGGAAHAQGRKKNRGKWKVRGDTNMRGEGEQDRVKDESEDNRPIEEDIESLISSNRILVPGAKHGTAPNAPTTPPPAPDQSVYDFDPPPPLDKQTELQYLLQKQNNPAQFLHRIPDLTKVGKNSKPNAIQKPGQQQRISDKNAKRIQKIGQIFAHKDRREDGDFDMEKAEGMAIFKNVPLNDECTIESIPTKRPADIDTLKNKWQMSESFTQVKKNLSELSKKLTIEKDPKKSSVKYLNPVKRLETNPSISVRELFPGEEEMNLQCSIEFNNVKAITPEGWEKCNTTIQYDLETKKLWSELQRPYGNQSSFLRHLILLEKYFRSGDLVLSQQARPHAVGYSESVQSRLRAYDHVVPAPALASTPRRQETSISLVEYRKRPSNGKSLLRTNRNSDGNCSTSISTIMPPPPPALAMPAPPLVPTSKKHKERPKKQLPPELIAINAPRKAIQSVLHNIQQLVRGVSAADPTELARTDPPPPPPPPAPTPPPPPPPAPPAPDTEPVKETTEIKDKTEPVKEKADTPKEKKDGPVKKKHPTSKPWRPTLMPITPENVARIAREPAQTAVDGRQLPSLVQVMSSGERYHITLRDYNKMCVMRREKLQQLHRPGKDDPHAATVTEVQTSAMLGNGGTVVQKIMDKEDKPVPELTHISSNAATILKNVGLKNITIAPIAPKTATMTSHTCPSPVVTSPALRLPQLPAVSITSEAVIMPKIPKSLTVIPQTVMAVPSIVSVSPSAVSGPLVAVSQGAVVPVTSQAVVSVVPQAAVVSVVPQDCARP